MTMGESEVRLSPILLNKLEEIAFFKVVDATNTEEQAKAIKALVRAFTKRGVSVRTILDALLEAYNEQQKGKEGMENE
jgi:methylaspartate ammonia-lyase